MILTKKYLFYFLSLFNFLFISNQVCGLISDKSRNKEFWSYINYIFDETQTPEDQKKAADEDWKNISSPQAKLFDNLDKKKKQERLDRSNFFFYLLCFFYLNKMKRFFCPKSLIRKKVNF
jgi:hypothetical protein